MTTATSYDYSINNTWRVRCKAYKHNYLAYKEIGGNVTAYHWETSGILWWRKKKWVKKKADELNLLVTYVGVLGNGDTSREPHPKKEYNKKSLGHELRGTILVGLALSSSKDNPGSYELGPSAKVLDTLKVRGVIVMGSARIGAQSLTPESVSVGET